MKVVFELDEHDIKAALTRYFESLAINVKEIKLIHYIDSEGYGMSEHDVPRVKIEIIKSENV